MTLNPRFWRDRRVLVTGHTGFKGSWLSLWLQLLGAKTVGYALEPSTPDTLFESAKVAAGMSSITGDVRDRLGLEQQLRTTEPEIVIHLAAQATVFGGFQDPVLTYETNVLGTVYLLEAVRQAPSVRAVVIVTSDKCYRDTDSGRPHKESDALGGNDPYSSSKACAEIVVSAYRSAFFGGTTERRVGLASARAGNVLGGGDGAPDRLVPDVIRAFQSGRIAQVRNPDHVRPWQHVLDALAGYLELSERLWDDRDAFSEPWNFGPPSDNAVSVAALSDMLARRWGNGVQWERDASAHPRETARLELDIGKSLSRLGWKPKLGLEAVVDWTVEWHQAVGAGRSPRSITERQIQRYG